VLGDRSSIPGQGRESSLLYSVQRFSLAHPAAHPLDIESIFVGGRNSEPWSLVICSAKVKNAWHHNSTSPYVFVVWCWIKHMDKFTYFIPYPVGQYVDTGASWHFKRRAERAKYLNTDVTLASKSPKYMESRSDYRQHKLNLLNKPTLLHGVYLKNW
jgi:hypothetical protein